MEIRDVIPEDAIPSIDEPTFGPEFRGGPDGRVVVPEVGSESPRAYPLRILNFHEIANDSHGGVPLAVTWCPLCGTIVIYDRRVAGETLTFGVSGNLIADNLVMYDRETGSLWRQSTGECIQGPMAGERLTHLPAIVTTWAQYRGFVDEPRVLQETDSKSEAASPSDEPARIDYDRDPYRRYFESDGFGLDAHRRDGDRRTWDRQDLDPKAEVIGIGSGESAVAVPRPWLLDGGNVAKVEADEATVVFGTESGMYAYEDLGFDLEHGGGEMFEGDGTLWNAVTGESRDGRSLTRIPVRYEFAFTWQDDHGESAFQGPD